MIGFTAPWLLVGLFALPLLWILLRAVPPAPIRRVNVLEWVLAVRQGYKSGKQNTQLEVQNRQCKVEDVLDKLVASLDVCRKHQTQYEWKNWMRRLDMEMSSADTHRVICTDFGATLDLSAAEKDNCSVDNHAVLAIYFVLSNNR